MSKKINIYTDGGSRGNPGPAAASFVLKQDTGALVLGKAFFLGKSTNNVAEYTGLVKALEASKQIGVENLEIFSDSELLVKQVKGQYRVKSENLIPIHRRIMGLLAEFESWKIQHVFRNKNKEADQLVNRCLGIKKDVEVKPKAALVRKKPLRLGVLISGGGTTMINILEQIKQQKLNAEIAVVISSLSKASGVEKAKNAGLKVEVIRKKDFQGIEEFSEGIVNELVAAKVDLVIQAGWLCLWEIPRRYENRVMNIHPALLPAFGGQGMWGHHVHQAVLEKGCKVSGCTVHFCTNEYDAGPIIVQRCCEVAEGASPRSLAARVFEQECIAYPQAIKLFAEDRLAVKGRLVKIKPITEE